MGTPAFEVDVFVDEPKAAIFGIAEIFGAAAFAEDLPDWKADVAALLMFRFTVDRIVGCLYAAIVNSFFFSVYHNEKIRQLLVW